MDSQNQSMLDLMLRPAFSVEDGIVTHINTAAGSYLLSPGTDIREHILSGRAEYAEFTGGCLYVTMLLGCQQLGVSIVKMGGQDIFLPEQPESTAELRAMALAAKELRDPLAGILAVTDRLFPALSASENQEHTAMINRRLMQLLRMVTNMSDAFRYSQSGQGRLEYLDASALFADIAEKTAHLLESAGLQVRYTGLSEPVYTLADPERLERAAYNILSNAAKFSQGVIDVSLTQKGQRLCLSVSHPAENAGDLAGIFTRFQREPMVEDSRYGMGLGMVLVRATAALHAGAVLVDQPEAGCVRTTLTLSVRQSRETELRSPVMRIDYAGEWDHGLLELSDSLPSKLYQDI